MESIIVLFAHRIKNVQILYNGTCTLCVPPECSWRIPTVLLCLAHGKCGRRDFNRKSERFIVSFRYVVPDTDSAAESLFIGFFFFFFFFVVLFLDFFSFFSFFSLVRRAFLTNRSGIRQVHYYCYYYRRCCCIISERGDTYTDLDLNFFFLSFLFFCCCCCCCCLASSTTIRRRTLVYTCVRY